MSDKRASPKDIRVVMGFKNNLILSVMENRGYKTVAELSRASGIAHTQLGDVINMKEVPTTKIGAWRTTVVKLANFFGCLPEDLFSEFQRENKLEKNRTHAEIHFGEIQAMLADQNAVLLDPSVLAEKENVRKVIGQAIDTLPKRFQTVIRASFGIDEPEMSPTELAKKMGISKTRVWQMQQKALRLLRHPRCSVRIREASGIDD